MDYLKDDIFAGEEGTTVTASDEEVSGFNEYMKTFTSALELERAAIEAV